MQIEINWLIIIFTNPWWLVFGFTEVHVTEILPIDWSKLLWIVNKFHNEKRVRSRLVPRTGQAMVRTPCYLYEQSTTFSRKVSKFYIVFEGKYPENSIKLLWTSLNSIEISVGIKISRKSFSFVQDLSKIFELCLFDPIVLSPTRGPCQKACSNKT